MKSGETFDWVDSNTLNYKRMEKGKNNMAHIFEKIRNFVIIYVYFQVHSHNSFDFQQIIRGKAKFVSTFQLWAKLFCFYEGTQFLYWVNSLLVNSIRLWVQGSSCFAFYLLYKEIYEKNWWKKVKIGILSAHSNIR